MTYFDHVFVYANGTEEFRYKQLKEDLFTVGFSGRVLFFLGDRVGLFGDLRYHAPLLKSDDSLYYNTAGHTVGGLGLLFRFDI